MPSAGHPGAEVVSNSDGTVTFQYKPTEVGVHELIVTFNEKSIDGTPFRCLVDKVGSGFVTAYGEGLDSGYSGKESVFNVVGGGRDLTISVDGPSKPEVKQNEKNGITNVTYRPIAPGQYTVNILHRGKHIRGSPFGAKVSGEGRKRSQWSISSSSEMSLGGTETNLSNLVGRLKLPNGAEEPCLLKKMPDGSLGIANFYPKSKGTYVVSVTQDGSHVEGSPFKVMIGDNEVCNALRVKLSGDGLKAATANKWNNVVIDVSGAGYGDLAVSVDGPHRSDVECKQKTKKTYDLKYKPHEPGLYMLNIRFGEDHVHGSPFMMNVGGEPSGRVRETVVTEISAVSSSVPNKKVQFQLKIPGTNPLDMEATVLSPSGKTDLCNIKDLAESLYDINFVPTEEGIHIVSLKHKGLHLTGSPFQYTVGKIAQGGAHKVEILGPGLERGEAGIKNEFNIYTREAGAGSLSVAIEGPCKAQLEVSDKGSGFTMVSYKVKEAGSYMVHAKWNNTHVPNSPVTVQITPEGIAAKQVAVQALRDRGIEVGKPVTFNVNKNKAVGDLTATLYTPTGDEGQVFIHEMDRDLYALRFTPTENGIHYVHIKLSDAHIPGSPFPILIGKLAADAAMVIAQGDGLTKAEVGQPAKFQAITASAGTGTLAVTIEGPSKVAISCAEFDEGYEFSYIPQAPGDYFIVIKYSGVAVAGCPTKAIVTGKGKKSENNEVSTLAVDTIEKKPGQSRAKKFQGDATKVVASGPGLSKGFLNRVSTFNVDVAKAGNGLLTAGVVTPTGNPVEELTYKKAKPGIYAVTYKSAEKGDHLIFVRWGKDEIPGSPFKILVG